MSYYLKIFTYHFDSCWTEIQTSGLGKYKSSKVHDDRFARPNHFNDVTIFEEVYWIYNL